MNPEMEVTHLEARVVELTPLEFVTELRLLDAALSWSLTQDSDAY